MDEAHTSEMLDCYDSWYDQAFERFRVDTGTRYPSRQDELDRHWDSIFKRRNKGPFVSSLRATQDMIDHNDLHRRISSAEAAAIARLQEITSDVKHGASWGPDIAVKAFKDLDLVFFGGKLNGHVCVMWDDLGMDALGVTEYPGDAQEDENQSHIVLNADLIFNQAERHPFCQVLHTLLHEMVHALDTVRCPHTLDPQSDGHDKHFKSRISAVNGRAKHLLGVAAVVWEPYKQCHFFHKSQRLGLRWSFGHVRSTRKDGGQRSKYGTKDEWRGSSRRGGTNKACIVM